MTANKLELKKMTATRNACKLCTPLGASLVFRGVKGAMPLIHGSQGCSTYIRRYIISHFKEPMDIASSNFSEDSTIFGGEKNLIKALENVAKQYNPKLIGVATSCLSETIGEDISFFIRKYYELHPDGLTVVHVSTPSYKGTHINGFHKACRGLAETLCGESVKNGTVNILPGFVSCEDIRELKEIFEAFKVDVTILPDYSETLDAPVTDEYLIMPDGGTEIEKIKTMNGAKATIEFGKNIAADESAGRLLRDKYNVPLHNLNHPIGIRSCDEFFSVLENITGTKTPEKFVKQRGRLIDSYIDAHKYLFGKKAIVYGEEDLVTAVTGFLLEIGIVPVLAAAGGSSGKLRDNITELNIGYDQEIMIMDGVDFAEIGEIAESLNPDIIIGNSKGNQIARKLNVPLVRIGFPIHDRVGGQRILTAGYRGTQILFDSIANALIGAKQDKNPVGYSYM